MLCKSLAYLSSVAGSTVTIVYAYKALKREVEKFSETPTVRNEFEYVLVRLARGDYNNATGIEQLMCDYKFYKAISKFHE